jgi:chemotaxis protein MotA
MDSLLEKHHAEEHESVHALQTMADGLPALGIVAAVLGVIKTMSSVDQPPEVLGKMIAAALVGTFLGVFLSYGVVGPIAARLNQIVKEEAQMYEVIKEVLISYLQGNAVQVTVEIGRNSIPTTLQPDFYEVEEAIGELPPIGTD